MQRSLARVVAAIVLFGTGLAATASAATAGTIAVTPTSDLANGGAVSVTAAGYSAADNPVGMYAAEVATVGGTVYANMGSAQYVPSVASGGFTRSVTVSQTFTSGATTIDCLVTQCQIAVWRAHGNPLPPDSAPQAGPSAAWPITGAQNVTFLTTTSVTVDPTTDLDPEGTIVTVDGAGFDPAVNPDGLYVAEVAWIDGTRYAGDAQWVTTSGAFGPALNPDGSFTATVNAVGAGTFSTGGPSGTSEDVDCTDPQTPCTIETWAAHTDSVPNWRSSTALTFASSGSGGDGGDGGGAFGLAVSPTSGLSTTGSSSVTVSGSGYSASEPGIYLLYGPMAGRSNPNAYYAGSQWLHVGGGNLSSTGSFSTTLAVAPTYTDGDGNVVNCTVVQCYVQTMRAHGMSDVDQDFAVPVSFGSTVPTPGADATAAQAPTQGTPSQTSGGPPSAGSSGPIAAPALGKLSVGQDGRARLKVTERSTVTFVLRKKVNGKWKVVKVVRVKAAGAGTVAAKLPVSAAGTYRISIKAVSSETGKASKKIVKNLTVKAKKARRD